MGANTDHALGRNLKFFSKVETTAGAGYGTGGQETLDAADAAKVLSTGMEFTVARADRMDARTSRSVLERITGKQEVSWNCESYLLPGGTSVAPDISPLLHAAFGAGPHTDGAGTATINAVTKANPAVCTTAADHGYKTGDKIYIGSVSGMTQIQNLVFTVTYVSATTFQLTGINSSAYGTFSSTATATLLTYRPTDTNSLPTIRMAREANQVLREDLFGCWVEEVGISASGGEEPKITFSGGAFNYALTGTGTTEGTGSGATSLVTEAGQGVNFMVGSSITFDDTSGTPVPQNRIVTAKDTDTLTVASSSWADAKPITPTTYDETTTGNPINGISGSLVLNGETLPITSFDMTLTNGNKALNDEAFEKGATDFIAGYRSVSGTVSVRARKDFIKSFAQRYVATTATADPTFTSVVLTVTLGSTSGKKCVLTLNNCELDFAAIDIPEAEEAVLNIPYTALGSSAADESNQQVLFDWNQT